MVKISGFPLLYSRKSEKPNFLKKCSQTQNPECFIVIFYNLLKTYVNTKHFDRGRMQNKTPSSACLTEEKMKIILPIEDLNFDTLV